MNVDAFIERSEPSRAPSRARAVLLEVSRAASDARRTGNVSARQRTDAGLTERIRQAPQASKGRYGAPRIHAQLRRQGHRHGRKRIAWLLRAAGLHGRPPRR